MSLCPFVGDGEEGEKGSGGFSKRAGERVCVKGGVVGEESGDFFRMEMFGEGGGEVKGRDLLGGGTLAVGEGWELKLT